MRRAIFKKGVWFGILYMSVLLPIFSYATPGLSYISDLISTSQPGISSNHTIRFTLLNDVPPGGRIVITPAPDAFTVNEFFGVTDIDVAVSVAGGPFIERALALLQTNTEDGVLVETGTRGAITITLASSSGITAGSALQIKLGTHASSQAVGAYQILNPPAVGSYEMHIRTEDVSGAAINNANTLIIIIAPVSLGTKANIDQPPYRFAGLPSGDISAENTSVEISLRTNEVSNCRYSTTASTTYAAMTGRFTNTDSTLHSKILIRIVPSTSYTFYVRCKNTLSIENPDDYTIAFATLAENGPGSESGGTGQSTGGGGGGGGGSGGGGVAGGLPFPSSFAQVIFDGIAYPGSIVTFVKDGIKAGDLPVQPTGRFSQTIGGLSKGTYTFGIYATDASKTVSAKYTTTFTLIGGTVNTVGNIFVPPTVSLKSDTVLPGELVIAQGYAIPSAKVEIWFSKQARVVNEKDVTKFTVASDAQGLWRVDIDTKGIPLDTYQVKARSIINANDRSDFGTIVYVGVGVKPKPDTGNPADLNRDGKVNLIDFSILLFHWGTNGGRSDPPADINKSGKVDLADFSIMLFNWTG